MTARPTTAPATTARPVWTDPVETTPTGGSGSRRRRYALRLAAAAAVLAGLGAGLWISAGVGHAEVVPHPAAVHAGTPVATTGP